LCWVAPFLNMIGICIRKLHVPTCSGSARGGLAGKSMGET